MSGAGAGRRWASAHRAVFPAQCQTTVGAAIQQSHSLTGQTGWNVGV